MSRYSDVVVYVGRPPDERSYRISLENGTPFRIESVFGGYLGRITFREVTKGGAVWRKALKAARIADPLEECASVRKPPQINNPRASPKPLI